MWNELGIPRECKRKRRGVKMVKKGFNRVTSNMFGRRDVRDQIDVAGGVFERGFGRRSIRRDSRRGKKDLRKSPEL